MKVTFLGTGTSQGIPVIGCHCDTCSSTDMRDKRLRTSVLVECDDNNIVIDTSPDFRQQMLREKVEKIHAILFTHEHRDHIAGLDDIRAYNFLQQKAIDVFGEERVIRALKYEFPYIFAELKYPGVPQVETHEINHFEFNINDLKVIPVRLMHFRLPILGFRIGDFSYITDANFISEAEKEKLIGTKYLVVNALRKEKHVSHFSLEQALGLIRELSPKKAFLTHLSHQIGLHAVLQNELPSNVFISYDGMQIEF